MSKKYVIANTGGLVIYDEKRPQKYGETKQYIINVTDKMIPFQIYLLNISQYYNFTEISISMAVTCGRPVNIYSQQDSSLALVDTGTQR